MAFIDIDRLYQSNKVPTQQDLDNIVDGIETFLNVTGVSDDNLQDATIDATTKIIDASVTLSKMATGAVGTTNIQSLAITTDKLADSSITTTLLADVNVTLAKVANAAATTVKFIDGSVDPIHITPNRTKSTSATNATVATSTYTSINTVAITTNGGPVLLLITPTESTSVGDRLFGYLVDDITAANPAARFKITRSGTAVVTDAYLTHTLHNDALSMTAAIPLSCATYIDTPSAGTYTYALWLKNSGNSEYATVNNINLTAWEL